jgi:hypothetical protein
VPARGLNAAHAFNHLLQPRDFFLCDMFDYAMKDDGASMEAPIFTLATRPDLTVWNWQSKDGNRALTVTPSGLGRATMFDKDVLEGLQRSVGFDCTCSQEPRSGPRRRVYPTGRYSAQELN